MLGPLLMMGASGAGAAADELPVAGALLWYDASDTDSITATGSDVTAWNDKSGNNKHLSTPGTPRPQTGTATVNGLNALDFGGATHISRTSFDVDLSTNKEITVFVVAESDGTLTSGQDEAMFSLRESGTYSWTGITSMLYSVSGTIRDAIAFGRSSGNFGDAGGKYDGSVAIGTTPHCFAARIDSGANTLQRWRDGSTITETAWFAYVNPTNFLDLGGGDALEITVGCARSGTSAGTQVGPWDGRIAEIVVYDTALSDSDVGLVNTYLVDKWGL